MSSEAKKANYYYPKSSAKADMMPDMMNNIKTFGQQV